MLTALFIVTTLICGIGWFKKHISVRVLAWYLSEKNVPCPSEEDLKRGNDFVVRHIVRDLLGKE